MPTNQHKPFTTIIGLSDQTRIPRLGRIRLGHTNINTISGKKHGVEDPFFQVPPEVQEVYGPTPTELDVLLPANDRSIVFPQALEYYGSSTRPLCTGNGQEGKRWNQEKLTYTPCACPCPLYGNGCSERGHLMVILPRVRNQGGLYQIDTGSKNAILGINSALNLIAPDENPDEGILGFIAMVPMKLRRTPRHIYPEGKHKITYPISLTLTASHDEIEELKKQKEQILAKTKLWIVEEPDRLNPESDPDAIVTLDEQTPTHTASTPPNHKSAEGSQVGGTAFLSTTTNASTLLDSSTPTDSTTATQTPQSQPLTSTDILTPQQPIQSQLEQTNDNNKPTSQGAHQEKPKQSVVTPLSSTITAAQLARILRETRKAQIPEEIVRNITGKMSKGEASVLIAQLAQKDYTTFETRSASQVPLQQSA